MASPSASSSSSPSVTITPLTKLHINLDAPRYDQSTFLGRVRHFVDIIDPSTLFVTDSKLCESQNLLTQYYNNALPSSISESDLWQAKKNINAVCHPDTGHKIPFPFRMSAFVPASVPIVIGMLRYSGSPLGTIFWQWINQSYNVAINHANRNASNHMSVQQVLKAYSGAVIASCTIALNLTKFTDRLSNLKISPILGKLAQNMVPFAAVAGAGTLNVLLMRWNEISQGIMIKDEDGNNVGPSKIAGKRALAQVALTRVILPIPVLMLPPIGMAILDRCWPSLVKPQNKRVRTVMELAVITGCLWGALPCAIGLFPQNSPIQATELEPEFQHLTNRRGQDVLTFYYNKGL